ncbi:MAG: nucleotidyltransferase domain-containing protein [Promethearchaeota archaeon]
MEQKNIRISKRLLEKHCKELVILKEFINKTHQALKDKFICAILIGSRARTDFNEGSDIDLILVGAWDNEILFDRIEEIQNNTPLPPLPIDFFLYRVEEIKKMIQQGNPMILDGFREEGICLYNDVFFQNVQDLITQKISEGFLEKKNGIWKVNTLSK